MRNILFLFITLIPLNIALDCRKFSFAPACRGIILKNILVFAYESMVQSLSWLFRQAEKEGIKDCVPISWIQHKLTFSSWLPKME
uniref:Secreted protein n=1 Tax=Angiostrongylus cantonensis TaxID=6313 RepID=A0A0K0D4K5_ANGCA